MADERSTSTLVRNARLLDPEAGTLVDGQEVLVVGDRIADVRPEGASAPGAAVIDGAGRTLLPGLIDAHVHVTAVSADLGAKAEMAPTYVTARTAHILRGMLDRGFTTVRDCAGADYGLADAIAEGWLEGPRLRFGGKALSQTGGHGDRRHPGRTAEDTHYCCPTSAWIVDGVVEVRRACREEIRRGAHHVKLMLSGGVASPTDRVDSTQFSLEEIRAAVEEAEAAGIYVLGHAYTARAVNRGLDCGVRSIEHGNLMDESSVERFQKTGAFYVPTLATYSALAARGREHGLPEGSYRKVFDVLDGGLRALEMAHRAGIPIVYGTDLLGGMHEDQLGEFLLRAQVQPAADILRSATTVAARLLQLEGEVGVIAPGALADLLLVEGDPLADISVLTRPETNLHLVMQGGAIVRDRLGAAV